MPNWCFTQMIFHGDKEEIGEIILTTKISETRYNHFSK